MAANIITQEDLQAFKEELLEEIKTCYHTPTPRPPASGSNPMKSEGC